MWIEITGNWDKGYAYDLHTQASIHVGTDPFGHNQFQTQRTEMGELLYQLKYRQSAASVTKIVDLLNQRFKSLNNVDVLVPCPSSKDRVVQPVPLIVEEMGRRFSRPVTVALLKEKGQAQAKDLDDPVERQNSLLSSIKLNGDVDFSGKTVLLIDDLFDTGNTLSVATKVLKEDAHAAKVFVLTMTKTKR